MHQRFSLLSVGALAAALTVAACTPAAPASPTAAPAKPTAQATTAPAAKPTAAPAVVASPAAAKPAASPTAQAAAKPAAGYDPKAIEQFYSGKTVHIVVGSSAGGGYDAYSRLIARHVGKYIPGNPTVIVDNMPGAGFILAANHVYSAAAKDGTVIGNIAVGALAQQVYGKEGVQFDAAKFQFLDVPTTDTDLCVATKESGFTSLEQAIGQGAKQFIVGGQAPGSSTEDEPRLVKAALNVNMKIVSGYPGTSKIRLAMDSGEVQGQCGWSWESLQATALDQVKSGEYVIVSQNSVDKPHRDLPNVPVAYQLAKTDEARNLIKYGVILINNVQREYLLAPEVPADRAQALRDAFTKVWKDPEFLADAQKAKLSIDPISAEVARKNVLELTQMPADIKQKIEDITK